MPMVVAALEVVRHLLFPLMGMGKITWDLFHQTRTQKFVLMICWIQSLGCRAKISMLSGWLREIHRYPDPTNRCLGCCENSPSTATQLSFIVLWMARSFLPKKSSATSAEI
jgi:hypothetical protein